MESDPASFRSLSQTSINNFNFALAHPIKRRTFLMLSKHPFIHHLFLHARYLCLHLKLEKLSSPPQVYEVYQHVNKSVKPPILNKACITSSSPSHTHPHTLHVPLPLRHKYASGNTFTLFTYTSDSEKKKFEILSNPFTGVELN